MKETLIYLLIVVFTSLCYGHYLDSNSISYNIENNQDFSIKKGVLNFSSKDAFLNLNKNINEQEAESFFNKEIKNIPNINFKLQRFFQKDSESF